MRILIFHNRYQQAGGEDTVASSEFNLLKDHGHSVELVTQNNDDIVGPTGKLESVFGCVYSLSSRHLVTDRLRHFKPDLVHVHNFFPKLSPSLHYACRDVGIPVVQTLHNFRLLCPAGTFLRDGEVCEECMGKTLPWPAVQHGCYRGSRLASAAVANMLLVHNLALTWQRTISCYIALTHFARMKFIENGLPGDKIVVKPNFVLENPDPGGGGQGGYALFVGRLSLEKGIHTMLAAWKMLNPRRQLKIAGDGPLAFLVQSNEAKELGIEFLGHRSRAEVAELMANATVLVFPSIWYEGFPIVIGESMAARLPVIASNIGAMAELLEDRKTGLLFASGRADKLAAAVEWSFVHPEELKMMRRLARKEYETKYTAEANYTQLLAIYRSCCPGGDHHVDPPAV